MELQAKSSKIYLPKKEKTFYINILKTKKLNMKEKKIVIMIRYLKIKLKAGIIKMKMIIILIII